MSLRTSPPTTDRASRRPVRRKSLHKGGRTAAIFLVPFFGLFLVSMVAPVLYALGLSLTSQQRSGLGLSGAETVFVGLGNYVTVLGSETFLAGLLRLVYYCLLYVPLMLGSALVLALLLDASVTVAKRTFQLLLFLPHAVPGVIAALIWAYLYTPAVSPIVQTLASGGIQIDFLGLSTVLPSIVNIAVWEWTGYNVIILFTALQAVPREVIEAARVDGASELRTAISIKTPLIRPALAVILLFTVIGTLQLFTEPHILAKSTTAVTSTWVPNMWAYDAAFNRQNLPQAAAASVILALFAALLSWLVTRVAAKGMNR